MRSTPKGVLTLIEAAVAAGYVTSDDPACGELRLTMAGMSLYRRGLRAARSAGLDGL